MGASTSVSPPRILNNIYVSYTEKDSHAILLHEELILNHMSNFFGPIENFMKDNKMSTFQLSPVVKNIMSNSFYIIIYISRATVASYYQALEINNAVKSNAHIMYIMTDKTYTPENTSFLKKFIRGNPWLPAYDEETLTTTLEELIRLLELK